MYISIYDIQKSATPFAKPYDCKSSSQSLSDIAHVGAAKGTLHAHVMQQLADAFAAAFAKGYAESYYNKRFVVYYNIIEYNMVEHSII